MVTNPVDTVPKAQKAQSAIEYLTTYGWAIIIIAVVLAALFELGLFSPGSFTSTTCVFPAEFGCLSAILYSTNSTISLNIQQAIQSNINVTSLACNNEGTIANMIAPYNPPSNQVTIGIGGNYTFDVACYNNGTLVSLVPGQVWKGYVLINYTELNTNFPHTVRGTVVAKAV